jgi:hypothetical protein
MELEVKKSADDITNNRPYVKMAPVRILTLPVLDSNRVNTDAEAKRNELKQDGEERL